VLALVAQVKNFYAACTRKVELDDDVGHEGWALFWAEWQARKHRAAQSATLEQ
jgi:hypothetical protein